MQIRDHQALAKPAIVLYRSDTEVGFGELEARANQLAHYFRRIDLRTSDTVAIVNNEHVHAVAAQSSTADVTAVVIRRHQQARSCRRGPAASR